MKKFIATILVFMSSYCLYADTDMAELLDLVITYNETNSYKALAIAKSEVKNYKETKVILDESDRNKVLTTVKTEVKNYNENKIALNEADRYINLSLFKLELTPNFFMSATAFTNTHVWYLWKNYEKAEGFKKIKIGEQLKKISNYYK